MKVNEMLVVLGGKDMILRREESLEDGVIQVRDPLVFLGRMELLSAAEHTNGDGGTVLASVSVPATPRRKQAKKSRAPSRKYLNPKQEADLIHSEGEPQSGPRLGYYRITAEDVKSIELALDRDDQALSNFQKGCLRLRFGLQGMKPHTIAQIAEAMLVEDPARISQEVKRGLRILGIKRLPGGRRRRSGGRLRR